MRCTKKNRRKEHMHITESRRTGDSWKENVSGGSRGAAEGLSPSLFLSWTKSPFVLGVSSWSFSTCNFQGSSKKKSRERRPYGFQHIKHQWAPDGKMQWWQNGQLVVSLPRRQNAIFWRPCCRRLFCYWLKTNIWKCVQILKTWEPGRVEGKVLQSSKRPGTEE